jgi:hypothetical protein
MQPVQVVLLDSGLNGMLSLPNVDLITLSGDPVNTRCFQGEVILDELKETGNLQRWEAYISDVICLTSTLLMQLNVGPTKGKKATDVRSFLGVSL